MLALLAISRASKSGASLTYAFFLQSGLQGAKRESGHKKDIKVLWWNEQKTKLPDQGVDLGNINIIKFLYGLLNLWFVGSEVNNKHQCVVILNFLHG